MINSVQENANSEQLASSASGEQQYAYKFTPDEYKKLATFVADEFTKYESYHKDRFDKAQVIYDRWSNEPAEQEESWHNAINVPVIIEGEQTVTPRIFTAIFPNDAPLDVQVEGNTPPDAGIRVKGIIQHYFRVCDVRGVSLGPITQATLFGTGYVDSGSWFIKRGYIRGEYKLIESRPDFQHVDFFEIFPHPAKRTMEDPLPVIRRRFIDKNTLLKMAGASSFVNMEEAIKSKGIQDPTKNYPQGKEDESYELLEYWGGYDETQIGKDKKEYVRPSVPYWCMIINRTVTIRAIPNPYDHQMPPYCKIKLFEDAKPCWFGVGIGQIGLPTQERLNKLVNQRLDNVDLILNKCGVYNGNDPMINVKELRRSEPGKWMKVSDVASSIKWMDIPDVTVSSYKEEELAKADFRESTGASAQLQPAETGQHRPGMGINMLQGAAGMRFQPVLVNIESQLIQQTAMFFFSNLKQFMTDAEWIMITGEDGTKMPIQVSPEQIQAKVFFIPRGISETVNKEIQVGQLLRFKEISANDPTVNRTEINKRIADLMGFKDGNKLIVVQPPPNQPSSLSVQEQEMIHRRMAEGASPEQIQMELGGPVPNTMMSDITPEEMPGEEVA